MNETIAYGKWFGPDGTVYRQRVTLTLTPDEYFVINSNLLKAMAGADGTHINVLTLRDNYTTVSTAAAVMMELGQFDNPRFKNDRNTLLRVHVPDMSKFVNVGTPAHDEIVVRHVCGLYVAALHYPAASELYQTLYCNSLYHFDDVEIEGATVKFVWFASKELFRFGIACAKSRLQMQILR